MRIKYYYAGIISAYEGNDLTGKHEHNEHKHYSESLIITHMHSQHTAHIGFMAINRTDDTSMHTPMNNNEPAATIRSIRRMMKPM